MMNMLANILVITMANLPRAQFQAQPFHLVTSSPWPLITSFTLLILTSGTVIYFNGYANPLGGSGLILVAIGFVTTASTMALWFRDVVAEGTFLGDHTFPVQKGITDRKSTRLNSSHSGESRMPSSA